MAKLCPGRKFPDLRLPCVSGGYLDSSDFDAPSMTVLNVYRGLHCPRCKAQIIDFQNHSKVFEEAGIRLFSISTDDKTRAEQAVLEWHVDSRSVAYGLTLDQANELGLFISKSRTEAEPEYFAEAALFFISPDGTLWGSVLSTFPFVRPTAEMVLDAVSAARDRAYPARGTVV